MKSEDSLLGQLSKPNSTSDGSLRKTVGRQLLTLSLLAFTAVTSTPIWVPESSIGADGPSTVSPFTDNSLEGVWDVTVTIRDAAGNPLRSFRAMNMYMLGGQFEEFGVGTPVGQRGPGMGVWQGEGRRRYGSLLEFFRFNADGTFAGTQKVTRTIELSEGKDTFISSASIQILDINGQLIQSGYATESATRFK
jgi:hypothetical protein